MDVRCDLCGQPATVREVTIKNGVQVEKHLCEACAKKQGFVVHSSLPQVITQIIAGAPDAGAGPAQVCVSCGVTFAQFRQSGLLGCPSCYEAFESQLTPLLARAQEGGTHHVGKIPKRLSSRPLGAGSPGGAAIGGDEDRRARIDALRKQLSEAIQAEQYERAAKLRDELQRLGERPSGRAPALTNDPAPPRGADVGRRKGPEAGGSGRGDAENDEPGARA
ncbi:MAG: UvrB/UvrC motif-containing protein [Phycisphaerae bacterium]|nr:UvrB/UvrC motif-containing protein [Phycisphaerae bacterium]